MENNDWGDSISEHLNFAAASLSHKLRNVEGVITVGIESERGPVGRSGQQLVVLLEGGTSAEVVPRRYGGCRVTIQRVDALRGRRAHESNKRLRRAIRRKNDAPNSTTKTSPMTTLAS